jgi:uncharacterized protein YqgV (UPF0045/DUF77 family)
MLPAVIRAEFTVYPFTEGEELPAHVQAAIDAATQTGVAVEIGALSNTVRGEPEEVLRAILASELAAFRAGARRMVVNIEVER